MSNIFSEMGLKKPWSKQLASLLSVALHKAIKRDKLEVPPGRAWKIANHGPLSLGPDTVAKAIESLGYEIELVVRLRRKK